MKSKEIKLTKERRLMDFRKEEFEIIFHYYQREDSGEHITTTGLDEWIINRVYQNFVQRNRRHIKRLYVRNISTSKPIFIQEGNSIVLRN
jgi:hypothetical protein